MLRRIGSQPPRDLIDLLYNLPCSLTHAGLPDGEVVSVVPGGLLMCVCSGSYLAAA
jgi:hypothetical protein